MSCISSSKFTKSLTKQEIISVNGRLINVPYGVKFIPNTNIIISHVSGKYIGV